jgi:hypothetical protein
MPFFGIAAAIAGAVIPAVVPALLGGKKSEAPAPSKDGGPMDTHIQSALHHLLDRVGNLERTRGIGRRPG